MAGDPFLDYLPKLWRQWHRAQSSLALDALLFVDADSSCVEVEVRDPETKQFTPACSRVCCHHPHRVDERMQCFLTNEPKHILSFTHCEEHAVPQCLHFGLGQSAASNLPLDFRPVLEGRLFTGLGI